MVPQCRNFATVSLALLWNPFQKKNTRGKPIYLPPLGRGFFRDTQHTWKKKPSAIHPDVLFKVGGGLSWGWWELGDCFLGPENLRWKIHYQDVA